MYFASDNWAGAARPIVDALSSHAHVIAPAYGDSELDQRVIERLKAAFECELDVFFVGTGTAANSLALASAHRPGGIALCHREAHLIEDECGAPEFFTGGGRLAPVDGPTGKISPKQLTDTLEKFDPNFVHHGRPTTLSLTQITEVGTVYSADEIDELTKIARKFGLATHMDGARFAAALAALNETPANITWKAGIDMLSFGGTKNGCWCAEALIVFDQSKSDALRYLQKQSAQLYSKNRFITAQFDAYLESDLWLSWAKHSNAMADLLRERIEACREIDLAWPTAANEVFVLMSKELASALQDCGVQFYPWPIPVDPVLSIDDDHGLYRFVTSFATKTEHLDDLFNAVESSMDQLAHA